jgi:hypothetical protein
MKKFLSLIIIIITSHFISAQTVINYDYMETFNWDGIWYFASPLSSNGGASTWATNVSVTPTQSAVLYGAGNGTSFIEQNWYSMPNITGLNINRLYQFKFKLASHTFTAPAAATKGLDGPDLLEVQVSTNGGVTYVSELRITGNANAQWTYNSTGSITHTANGSFTNSAAPTGDVYTSPAGVTTTGYSTVTLNLPANISQVAVDIFCRVNSTGEEWWIDNIELLEIVPLPIELMSFDVSNYDNHNLLTWSSASEHNNDYYLLERSTDGYNWTVISNQKGVGNSTTQMDYSFRDFTYEPTTNYYQLTQVDFDGQSETFKIIAINNTGKYKEVLYITNTLGQIVDDNTKGWLIIYYTDGTNDKIYR